MYDPPIITHIDQILPLLEGKDEFIVKHKDGYIVIDYVFETPDTFTDPLLIECRGIKFHSNGKILARPFNKFFNINQHESTKVENVQWDKEHIVLEKLDGSMIHSAWLDDKTMLLMTRMGNTDVAQKAEQVLENSRLKNDTKQFLRHCYDIDVTPIFEYIAPDNRIVIRYDKPDLVLLAARHIVSGQYLSRKELEVLAGGYYIPIVPVYKFNSNTNPLEFIEQARKLEGIEGYVIHFQGNENYNNLLMKLKGDDYVLKHKTKSYFDHEKNVLQIILDDKVDDLIPLLDPAQVSTLVDYAATVNSMIRLQVGVIKNYCDLGIGMDRKEFAVNHAINLDARHRGLMFGCVSRKVNDEETITKLLKESYKKQYNSQTRVDENRDLIGMQWHGEPSTGE